MSFTNAFRSLSNKMQRLQQESLQLVAVLAERHYRDNFKASGFVDSTLERWKPLAKRSGKPLIKTGNLRGSIRSQIISRNTVIIATDVAYAKFHNEGVGVPVRKFIGRSASLNKKILIEIDRLAKRIL